MKLLFLIISLNLTLLAQEHFRFTTISKKFDVEVTAERNESTEWRGKTKVALFRKGAPKPFQIIHLKDTRIGIGQYGAPEIASVKDKKNGKWSWVYVEDFNFDGFEDLAFADGNNGGYGGTSYSIYLYTPNRDRFTFSRPYTRLAQGPYIGIPETNERDRALYVFWKTGCCTHFEETYQVTRSHLKLIEERSESQRNGYIDIEIKKLIRGKWRTWNKRERDRRELK